MDSTIETTVETTQAVEETTAPETVAAEETTIPDSLETIEETLPEETHEISETLDYVPDQGFVLEDIPDYIQETVPMTTEPVYIEVIEAASSNIIHANLFGAFLICGTLVGIFLLRGRYGT